MEIDYKTPVLSPPREGGGWRLEKDWTVRMAGSDGRWSELTVKAGFKTDGASIPRWLWRLCGHPLEVPRLYAAMVHDYIYSGYVDMKRKEADALYREMLIALGAPKWKAYAEWTALRAFGWTHWR